MERATSMKPPMASRSRRRRPTSLGGTALVSQAYPPYIHQTLPNTSATWAMPMIVGSRASKLVSWVMVKTKTRSKKSSRVETRSSTIRAYVRRGSARGWRSQAGAFRADMTLTWLLRERTRQPGAGNAVPRLPPLGCGHESDDASEAERAGKDGVLETGAARPHGDHPSDVRQSFGLREREHV